MAVYYKHIKGCMAGATDLNNLTYIVWTDTNPTLTVGSQDRGTILSTNGGDSTIADFWTFNKGIETPSIEASSIVGTHSDENPNKRLQINRIEVGYDLSGENIESALFHKNIAVEGRCNAASFNATSDIRAKTNIKPATYSALDLISKLSVFNYNYINMPNSRETGIIAQELLEKQPEELDLVVNPNASGENGDFMSIKTDKLVMVLLKAIQEQQEEINLLKEEINKLK